MDTSVPQPPCFFISKLVFLELEASQVLFFYPPPRSMAGQDGQNWNHNDSLTTASSTTFFNKRKVLASQELETRQTTPIKQAQKLLLHPGLLTPFHLSKSYTPFKVKTKNQVLLEVFLDYSSSPPFELLESSESRLNILQHLYCY